MTLVPHLLNLFGKKSIESTIHFSSPRLRAGDRKTLARELRAGRGSSLMKTNGSMLRQTIRLVYPGAEGRIVFRTDHDGNAISKRGSLAGKIVAGSLQWKRRNLSFTSSRS